MSFKQTKRDLKLYTEVKDKEEFSDFIKDAIEFYLKHLENIKEHQME